MSVEHDLRTIAAAVEWPPTPALAHAVEERIAELGRPRPRRRLRLAVVALAAAVAAFGAVLALSPGARSAVLDFLRIGGAQVTRVEKLPDEAEWQELGLGRLVTVSEARRITGLPVRVPDGASDASVFFDQGVAGGGVWLVWCCDPKLLLLQARGEGSVPFAGKLAGPGTRLEYVSVDGRRGAWISGDPHAVYFSDADGQVTSHPLRLSGNVLLWDRDGVTYRLEGARTLVQALDVAESLR